MKIEIVRPAGEDPRLTAIRNLHHTEVAIAADPSVGVVLTVTRPKAGVSFNFSIRREHVAYADIESAVRREIIDPDLEVFVVRVAD